MILVDHMIADAVERGVIAIKPFTPEQVQPSSYDFLLADTFRVFDPQAEVLDPRSAKPVMVEVKVAEGDFFVLHPGQFALASSVEWFTFPAHMVGQVNGKSSLGRMGLQVHATAGFFDPGWDGEATLELSNVSPLPLRLYPGMKIAQMVFMYAAGRAHRPYGSEGLGSKYQGQRGPAASLYHENFDDAADDKPLPTLTFTDEELDNLAAEWHNTPGTAPFLAFMAGRLGWTEDDVKLWVQDSKYRPA